MNHDYTHCADYEKSCPGKCFRAQLCRDLERYGKLVPYAVDFPIRWAHFRGTEECRRGGQLTRRDDGKSQKAEAGDAEKSGES